MGLINSSAVGSSTWTKNNYSTYFSPVRSLTCKHLSTVNVFYSGAASFKHCKLWRTEGYNEPVPSLQLHDLTQSTALVGASHPAFKRQQSEIYKYTNLGLPKNLAFHPGAAPYVLCHTECCVPDTCSCGLALISNPKIKPGKNCNFKQRWYFLHILWLSMFVSHVKRKANINLFWPKSWFFSLNLMK